LQRKARFVQDEREGCSRKRFPTAAVRKIFLLGENEDLFRTAGQANSEEKAASRVGTAGC